MKKPVPRAGAPAAIRRKRPHRPHRAPKWLRQPTAELNAIAQSRCMMILSVLSGEKPVTDAIAQARISRQAYYQMETRALNAMLAVLNPLASTAEDGSADLAAAAHRITELEAKAQRLEQEKRRADRLLQLTRKTIRAPAINPRGPWTNLLSSIPNGRNRSPHWKAKAAVSGSSIPTKAGEAGS